MLKLLQVVNHDKRGKNSHRDTEDTEKKCIDRRGKNSHRDTEDTEKDYFYCRREIATERTQRKNVLFRGKE